MIRTARPPESPGLAQLDRLGVALVLALPVFLTHGHGIADAINLLLALLFLARSALAGDWTWLRRTWVRVGLAWWAWLSLCSVRWGGGQLLQAVLLARFLLLVAALEHWLLRDAAVRAWLARLVRIAFAYLALNSALQFATGRNLYGWPRGADSELTGPYRGPRAGPILARTFFPALLPPTARLLAGEGWRPLWGAVLLLAGVALMVLTGQRVPLLLVLLGLLVTALFMPRLRGPVIVALVGAGLLLAASPVISPPAFHRQVEKFSAQMLHFQDSPYGQILARGLAIGNAHPVMGRGFDGFREACDEPAYFQGWRGDDGGGAAICVQHPHNFYLQAYVEAGVPGLVLYGALVVTWLSALLPGLLRDSSHGSGPLRVALFTATLLHEWPIASSSSIEAMPLSGWSFLLLGLGLAETRAYIARQSASEVYRG